MPFYFGGTSLLIIVVVTMDFMAQVQAYVMTHQYESLLKKANFKGGLAALTAWNETIRSKMMKVQSASVKKTSAASARSCRRKVT